MSIVATMTAYAAPASPPPAPPQLVAPAVGATLARRPRVTYVEVAAAPVDATWRPLLDLCADIGPWLARVAPRTGGDPIPTAAFLCGWVARAVAAVPATVVTADSRALIANAGNASLCLADGGWVTGIALAASGVLVDSTDPIAALPGAHAVADVSIRWRQTGETIAALARPVIAALGAHSRLRPAALWALVVDAVSVAVTAQTDDPCRARAVIDGVCGALPFQQRRTPAIESVDLDGDVMLRASRTGCCFSYRTPDASRCVDCPNRATRVAE